MIKHLLAVLTMVLACAVAPYKAVAQLFTTFPAIVQNDTKDLKIYFHPDRTGKNELINASSLYAHIGVTLDSAPTTWTHVKGDWNSNTSDKQFVKQADGTWMLNIGDMRTYFGLSDKETVAKIAIIARIASGAGNGYGQTDDCFIDVAAAGLQVSLATDGDAATTFHGNRTVSFTVNATASSALTLSVNGNSIGTANGTVLKASYDFTASDTPYKVMATAKSGSQTVSEEMEISCMPASAQKSYPGGTPKQGAVKNSDGTVTFCLAAPGKTNVLLVGAWDDYRALGSNVMNYTDHNGQRYFWTTIAQPLADNKYYPYYYMVDGSICVGDPYAKLILDPYSDQYLPANCFAGLPSYPTGKVPANTMLAVYRGDIDNYKWDSATTGFQIPDHRSLTIYEMLIRDFSGDGSDSDGKSFGTLKSAIEHLDYVASLGVNAIELMPVMEFNGNNSWGYNTNFYMALDKAYGRPDDLRDFVAACHRRGMAVILDIVFNQSDGLAPWYQMYGGGSNNPFYNATAPHDYSVLNDWNQDNPIVKQHWKDVLTFWLTSYQVDGFRFDLVKGLGANNSYTAGTDGYNSTRVALMKELNDALTAVKPNAIHINELLGTPREENENGQNGQMGWNKVSSAAYDYATARPSGNSGNLTGFVSSNWGYVVGQTVDYAESHDEARVASKLRTTNTKECDATVAYTATNPKASSVKRLGAVAAQMLLTPGSKMIWQFGEIGADDAQGSDLNKLRAIAPKWDQMTNTNRAALLENYREMVQLRKKNPELFNGEDGTCTLTGYNDNLSSVRTIRLTSGNKEVIAFFNPATTGAAKNVTAIATKLTPDNAQLITASAGTTPTLNASGSTLTVSLSPNEFAVFATTAVSGIGDVENDMDHSAKVSAIGGRIVVSGDHTDVAIYNPAGTMVASRSAHADSSEFDVAPGIYVVIVDGTSTKVAVR